MGTTAPAGKTAITDDLSIHGGWIDAPENLSSDEPALVDERLWAEEMVLTDGAAVLCFQCGVCTAACPWGLVKDETFSVRSLLRRVQLGLDGNQADAWLCTTCGQCERYCPRGVRIGDVMRGIRYQAWEDRQTPPGLPSLLWSLHGNNNPWGQPPSTRSLWARDLAIPIFDAGQHEILLYFGCTAAYDRRVQDVSRSLVKVLRAAGVAFGYLADEEPCCGESALSLGHEPLFSELMSAAAERFRSHAVKRLVTLSPHCFDAFKNHLAAELEEIEVLFYVQYLAALAGAGRITFSDRQLGRITFHDPCYLARHHDDTSSARTVLGAIPGITLVEMAHHGQNTLCCGGGGGRMWLETAPDERFADIRVGEAVDVKAQIVSTACPFCLTCLEDSVKALKVDDLHVLELAEILSMVIEGC